MGTHGKGKQGGEEAALKGGLDEVSAFGASANREMAITFDGEGNRIGTAEGSRGSVSPVVGQTVIHNHPGPVGLSPDDIAFMHRHPAEVQHVIAIDSTGAVYRISRTGKTSKNEWPGSVEKEYLAIDASNRYPLRTMMDTPGITTISQASSEIHHLMIRDIAAKQNFDYKKYLP